MYKLLIVGLTALFFIVGCGTPATIESLPTVRLVTDSPALRAEAVRALKINGASIVQDDNAIPLFLREKSDKSPNAIAADGSVGSYEVSYSLTYRFGNEKERTISNDYAVDNNENEFHASTSQRQQIINGLRRSALTRMIYILAARRQQP